MKLEEINKFPTPHNECAVFKKELYTNKMCHNKCKIIIQPYQPYPSK